MNKKIENKTKKVETKEVKKVEAKKTSSFKKKKKVKKNITSGIAFVYSTFNTIIFPCKIAFDLVKQTAAIS